MTKWGINKSIHQYLEKNLKKLKPFSKFKYLMKQPVVNGTIILSSEPFHGFFLWNSMLGSNSWFASSSQSNSASWSFKDNVKVHTENTSEWIILDTQINVLLNTETETSSIWEIDFSQFSVLDFKSSFENFISLVSSDSDVSGDFLVSLNTETSDGESCSGMDFVTNPVNYKMVNYVDKYEKLFDLLMGRQKNFSLSSQFSVYQSMRDKAIYFEIICKFNLIIFSS